MSRRSPFAPSPAGDLSGFTAMPETNQLVRIDDGATPYLQHLAREFPREFNRALPRGGFYMMNEIKRALRAGGPAGMKWPEVSRMREYRRMEMLDSRSMRAQSRLRLKKLSKKRQRAIRAGTDRDNMLLRWKVPAGGRNSGTPFGGRMAGAVRYEHYADSMRVVVGFINSSAAELAAAVQAGRRGRRGVFQFDGRQPVTPAMRRAFWAAGVPLSKNTTMLEQPERPLIDPVFRAALPGMLRIIEERVALLVSRRPPTGLAAAGARQLMR